MSQFYWKFSVFNEDDTPLKPDILISPNILEFSEFHTVLLKFSDFYRENVKLHLERRIWFSPEIFMSLMNFTMFIQILWFCLRKFSSYDRNYDFTPKI